MQCKNLIEALRELDDCKRIVSVTEVSEGVGMISYVNFGGINTTKVFWIK